MSTPTPVRRLAELNAEITRLEAEAGVLEKERRAAAREAAKLARRARYLQFLRWFRSFGASLPSWPLLVLTIGPFLVAVLAMIIVDTIFDSRLLALAGFLVGAAGGAGLFAMWLYRPDGQVLAAAIPEAESQSEIAKTRLTEAIHRCATSSAQLKSHLDERHEIVTSDKLQRAMLLQRDWKAMRDDEWEDYLAEVCRTLGAKVDRSGRIRGEGIDMIVEFGERRIAVAAHGEGHNVNSGTIQKSIAACEELHCDSCAVIVNRRFTGAAQDFAQCNGCTAIGAEEFPDFVMGKIDLC
jgi:Restriction endonuclease